MADAVIVHVVWSTISGAVKVATYVPFPLSTTAEKTPPLLDARPTDAPMTAAPPLEIEALIIEAPPE